MLKKNCDSNLVFIFIATSFYIFTSLFFIFYGRIHVDEPFYFTIANLIVKGYIPYKDFFYTQTPLFPYIYSFPQLLFGSNLYIGRATSVLLGLMTYFLVVGFCYKKKSTGTSALASGLIAFNPFLIYHFTFVKLYSLLAFLVVLTIIILFSSIKDYLKFCLVSVLLTLCTSIRITLLPALLMVCAYIIFIKKDYKTLLIFIGSSLIIFTFIFSPFLVLCKDQLFYDVYGYLKDRDVLPFTEIIKAKIIMASEVSKHFEVIIIILILIFAGLIKNNKLKSFSNFRKYDSEVLAWLILLSLILPYVFTKIAYVGEYISFTIPLLVMLTSFNIESLFKTSKSDSDKIYLMIILISALAISWIKDFPGFVEQKNGKPPIRYLLEVANKINETTKEQDKILSFNNAIVLMANREILPGYEMNSCSFDLAWDKSKCEKYRILNVGMLSEIIEEKKVAAILITDNTFLGNFPSFYNLAGKEVTRDTLMPLIKKNYLLSEVYLELGNQSEKAYLYLPNK
jgi:hypothetical protein